MSKSVDGRVEKNAKKECKKSSPIKNSFYTSLTLSFLHQGAVTKENSSGVSSLFLIRPLSRAQRKIRPRYPSLVLLTLHQGSFLLLHMLCP